MAEIVNLRRARKAAARAECAAEAAVNRARHGAAKSRKARTAAEQAQHTRTLEGAKRERPE